MWLQMTKENINDMVSELNKLADYQERHPLTARQYPVYRKIAKEIVVLQSKLDCDSCYGSGVVNQHELCSQCGGTGNEREYLRSELAKTKTKLLNCQQQLLK